MTSALVGPEQSIQKIINKSERKIEISRFNLKCVCIGCMHLYLYISIYAYIQIRQ